MARPSSPTGLNVTSASVLGLLSLEKWPRPWTSYELTKQSRRSLRWFWPRAQRQLFSIPKKLVKLGYAEAHPHDTGKRPGTRYTITAAGRAAFKTWLGEPGTGVNIEAEELVRVFFADQGTIEMLRATLHRIAEEAADDRALLGKMAAEMDARALTGRAAVNALSVQLVSDVQAAVENWAHWALEQTADWKTTRENWEGADKVFDNVIGRQAIKSNQNPTGHEPNATLEP